MDALFIRILNMSLGASYVIVAVLILRLLLRKAPKSLTCLLWLVVLVRLLAPVSLESVVSLVPVKSQPIPRDIAYQNTPVIDSGIKVIDQVINPVLPAATPVNSANPMQIWLFIGEILWVAGMAALLVYSLISLAVLLRRLRGARHISQNIYAGDGLETAFVLGVVRPRIYLPETLGEKERAYILRHEEMHIKRKDHILRLLGFLALCVHWFNPLVWAAFLLLTRDMEMACDEAVLKEQGTDSAEFKKAYSASLLSLATGRRIIGGAPLAFGEGEVKGRVKNVLKYKKPGFWIVLLALAAVILAAVCLLTSPAGGDDPGREGALGQIEGVSQRDGITVVPLEASDMAEFSEAAQYWYGKVSIFGGGLGTYHLYPLESENLAEGEEGYLVYFVADQDHYSYFELTAKKRKGMLEIAAVEQDAVSESGISDSALAAVVFPKGEFTAEQIKVGGEEAAGVIATEDMTKVTVGKADWSVLLEAPDGDLSEETLAELNRMFSPSVEVDSGIMILNPNGMNCLIRTFFENPEMLNFASFLYLFPLESEISAEEKAVMEAWDEWPFSGQTFDEIPVPVHKFTAENINRVLDFYLGITLEDLPTDSKEQLLYFDQYDSYYNFTSDYGPGQLTITNGVKEGDTVALYSDSFDYADDSLETRGAVLTLKEKDGRYLMESFLPQS